VNDHTTMPIVKSALGALCVGAAMVNAQMYMWELQTGCGGVDCKLLVDADCTSLSTENEKASSLTWDHCNQGCIDDADCVGFNFNPSNKGKIGGCYFLQGTCDEIVSNTDGVQGVIKGAETKQPTAPTIPMSCSDMTPVKQEDKSYSCEMAGCAVVTGGSKKTKDWTCADETDAPVPAPTAPTVYSCAEQEVYVEKVGKTKTEKCGDDAICAVVKVGKKKECVEKTDAPSPAPTSPTVYSCAGQEVYVEKVGKTKTDKCGDDSICAVVKVGKKKECVEKTDAPSPAPTAPTVYDCADFEPYQVKEGKAKVWKCGDDTICAVEVGGSGKKKTYLCVFKTDAPAPAPTAPTAWSCAVDMIEVKKGKRYSNECATPEQCELEQYKEDGKKKERCVAIPSN
jgi:hypothetical protein